MTDVNCHAATAALCAFALITGCSASGGAGQQAVLNDIAFGKTIGGTLHSESGQWLCLDAGDAMRGALRPEDTPADEEVRNQLIETSRCTWSDPKAGFSMTADGQEHFATPDGSISLWSSR